MAIDRKKLLKDWGPMAAVGVLIALAWNVGWIPSLGGETVGVGQPATDFVVANASGPEPIRLSAYRGQVVLVNFWATWCPPCRMEIPSFIGIQDRYQGKGFRIVGVALDHEGARVVAPFVRDHGINYPVGLAHQAVVTAYGGIRRVPTSFLIDRQGKVVKQYVGLLPGGRLERDLQALL